MRSVIFALVISGILAACRSQPQAQQQPRGAQIGQSTAPLPPDPNAPVANDQEQEGESTSAPISTPPAAGDVGSPVSPAPSGSQVPPGDAGVDNPDAGDLSSPPPTTTPPNTTPDAGVVPTPPELP